MFSVTNVLKGKSWSRCFALLVVDLTFSYCRSIDSSDLFFLNFLLSLWWTDCSTGPKNVHPNVTYTSAIWSPFTESKVAERWLVFTVIVKAFRDIDLSLSFPLYQTDRLFNRCVHERQKTHNFHSNILLIDFNVKIKHTISFPCTCSNELDLRFLSLNSIVSIDRHTCSNT